MKNSKKSTKVFWLSERKEKRESDATVLIRPGTGVRFDIGFIGSGNTEVSLDKVSRFEREMELGNKNHYMSTIILIDRIGEGSRIIEMAKAINGSIIQMSMTNWVKEICIILKDKTNFSHAILSKNDAEIHSFIKEKMKKIDIKKFIF